MRRSIIALAAGVSVVLSTVAATPDTTTPRNPASARSQTVEASEAAKAASSAHFTASGDFSAGGRAASVLDQIDSIDPDLHLALGDLSYGEHGSEAAWCEFVTSRVGRDFPFQLVAGNHESDGRNGHIDNFAECLPNRLPGLVGTYARQYYVDVPRDDPVARFIMISPALGFEDGVWSYEEGTSRYRWTENAIDSARADGVPWVVVGMHKPCLSVGQYDCDPGSDLLNLLLKKRVDLVLSGHEHLYARSKQLALSTSCPAVEPGTYLAACVADDSDTMLKRRGTVFATVGTGGVPLRDVYPGDPEAPYFASMSGSNLEPTWGNLEMSVTGDALAARFRPSRGSGFTDSFTITAESPEQPSVLARDTFSRTVVGGLGSADVGGAWATSGSAWRFSVDGEAHIRVSPNDDRNSAYLGDVLSLATDLRATVSANSATPLGASFALSGRTIPGIGAYQAKVVLAAPGVLRLSLVRVGAAGGGEVVLQSAASVPQLSPRFDDDLEIRVQVIGANPTVVRAKVWESGTAQPAEWLRSVADGTSALQRAGTLGFTVFAPDLAAMAPAVVTVDNLRAVVP